MDGWMDKTHTTTPVYYVNNQAVDRIEICYHCNIKLALNLLHHKGPSSDASKVQNRARSGPRLQKVSQHRNDRINVR